MRARSVLLAFAAGLALADASIVTLALPELLVELDTTVEGVAAVIGVYAAVLAAALIPAWRAANAFGAANVAAAGFALFGVASGLCAVSSDLPILLVGRALQAVGGAAALVTSFALLASHTSAKQLWLGAAVLSAAVGPALGGALTQAFAWESIFLVQVPVALAAAVVVLQGPNAEVTLERSTMKLRPAIALGLLSAALTAVLFLLVLLLVAGWATEPLRAALAVTVLPIAALAGSRVRGEAVARAAAGCLLVGGGTIALAYLPDASAWWTVLPQVLAGLGMGMALPALAGELLPERTAGDAAVLLAIRHAAIVVLLAALAPVTAQRLEDATQSAREQGIALVLDAQLPPQRKLALAPDLLAGVEEDRPRAGLQRAFDEVEDGLSEDDERTIVRRLADRTDETLVSAVGDSFLAAFLITGALGFLAAGVLAPRTRLALPAAAIVAVVVVGAGQVAAHRSRDVEPVRIADPCTADRDLPSTGGITGFLQDRALEFLDSTACDLGSSREELVLALADEGDRQRFIDKYGEDPQDAAGLLGSLLG